MPRVQESSTTRAPLPEDVKRRRNTSDDNTAKPQHYTLLDDVDKQNAMNTIQQKKEAKQQEEQETREQKKRERQQIAQSEPIFKPNLRNNKSYKQLVKMNKKIQQSNHYTRPKFQLSKKNQGYYQVVSNKRNKAENVRRAMMDDRDIAMAEMKLLETEVLRNVHVPSGIELDESDDVFSSTDQITQNDLIENSDLNAQKKVFDLLLDKSSTSNSKKGPYQVQYTSSGRGVLIGGHGGHISALKWNQFELMHEVDTEQPIYAMQWMMDDSMYAVAQQLRTYVFNDKGVEIHSMHDFYKVRYLSYLPFHFLLVGATKDTNVIYKDISIGKNVANIQLDPTHCMTPNHYNAVMCVGHSNGQVSMVTPRDHNKKPVVSMFCHQGPVKHIAVDPSGQFMVTASMDNTAKVWDIRKTYQPLSMIDIPSTVSALTISQTGMTAIGYDDCVVIWKHATHLNRRAYMKHKVPIGNVRSLDFCPYEDVLGIGHTKGFSSILIPGSGQQNYDSRLPNPYSTEKQIKDYNVKSLLEKIPSDMITLNPHVIGTSGQLEKTQAYSENVEMTEDLKSEMEKIGVHNPDEQVAKRKKLHDSRDELRDELYKKNDELKASVSENWWEDKKPSALDRFASLQKRKAKNDDAEDEDEESDNDEGSDSENDEMEDLERQEREALKFMVDSDDEDELKNKAFQSRTDSDDESDDEESDDSDDEDNDANLLGDFAQSDDDDEKSSDKESSSDSSDEDDNDSSSDDDSSDDDEASGDSGIVDPFDE